MYFNNKQTSSDHGVNLNWCSRCMPQPVNFSSQLCENHVGMNMDGLSISQPPATESPKLNFDLLSKFEIDPDMCFDTPPDQKEDIRSTSIAFSDMVYSAEDHLIICISGTRILQSRRSRTSESRNCQKLLKYSEKGKYVAQCILEGSPRKICLLSSVEAVVTLGKKIQFVSMPDMSPGRSMLIGSDCTGIAVVNNMIYVGDTTKMHVLDKIGRLLKTIDLPFPVNTIHLNADGRLYCTTGVSFCSLTLGGSLIYSYNSSDLGTVNTVRSDKQGNIYVAGDELQMFYPYKSQVDRILGKEDGLGVIHAICFNNTQTKIFVANNDRKNITVYTLNDSKSM